jgi:hypothetical protein
MSLLTMFFGVQNFINMQKLTLIKCFERYLFFNVSLDKYVSNFDKSVLIKILKIKLKFILKILFIFYLINHDYNGNLFIICLILITTIVKLKISKRFFLLKFKNIT